MVSELQVCVCAYASASSPALFGKMYPLGVLSHLEDGDHTEHCLIFQARDANFPVTHHRSSTINYSLEGNHQKVDVNVNKNRMGD